MKAKAKKPSRRSMNKDELQKLRDLPIEGVAERLGFDAERYARYFEHP